MRLKIAVHPFDALRVIRFKDSHNVRVRDMTYSQAIMPPLTSLTEKLGA